MHWLLHSWSPPGKSSAFYCGDGLCNSRTSEGWKWFVTPVLNSIFKFICIYLSLSVYRLFEYGWLWRLNLNVNERTVTDEVKVIWVWFTLAVKLECERTNCNWWSKGYLSMVYFDG